MPLTNDRALTVRLPKELYEQLSRHASLHDRTVASLLRVIARQYLSAANDGESNRSGVGKGVA